MLDMLLDSLSRCFGTPADGNTCATIIPLAARPKGASRCLSKDGIKCHYPHAANTRQKSAPPGSRTDDHSRRKKHRAIKSLELAGKEFGNLLNNVEDNVNTTIHRLTQSHHRSASSDVCEYDSDYVDVLAEDKCHSSTHSTSRRYNQDYSYSSSVSHRANLEKARTNSNKRKADIFRSHNDDCQMPKPNTVTSFASRLLGGNSSFNTGAILCFANPIVDDEDRGQHTKLRRMDSLQCSTDMDAETIASTLYFDAKYEHMTESKPPVPLYPEFSVPISTDSCEEIRRIFESGSHKTINMIHCGVPPPPPPFIAKSDNGQHDAKSASPGHGISLYDGISSECESFTTEASYYMTSSNHDANQTDNCNKNEIEAALTDDDDSIMQCRSSVMTQSENSCPPEGQRHLEVISDWVCSSSVTNSPNAETHNTSKPPGLKLLNKSSVSTAALTPACSTQSYITTSPIQESFHQKNCNVTVLNLPQTHTPRMHFSFGKENNMF